MFKRLDKYLAKKYGYSKEIHLGKSATIKMVSSAGESHTLTYPAMLSYGRPAKTFAWAESAVNNRSPIETDAKILLERCHILSYEISQGEPEELESELTRMTTIPTYFFTWAMRAVFAICAIALVNTFFFSTIPPEALGLDSKEWVYCRTILYGFFNIIGITIMAGLLETLTRGLVPKTTEWDKNKKIKVHDYKNIS